MAEKIVSRERLVELVRADRAAGRSIAFANGCFDLLHVGHVRYLEAAAAEADRLIVAVNDDSGAASKGPGRPILKADERAELVAALRAVDYVVIFNEPDVAPLLTLLKPDVHCKGTDYTADSVPERETVLAYGGRIAIVGDPKDHSTRDLIAKIRRGGQNGSTEAPSFLIVRLGALGDIVHAVPAVAALRRAYPDARIHWLVDARHRPIVDLIEVVDTVIVLERPSVSGWLDVTRELRRTRYDAAIDLQGLLKSAILARASGASRVIGFSIWHLREKTARPFYTETDRRARLEADHVILKNLRLLSTLGVQDDRVEFPLADVESPALAAVRSMLGGERPFALINPGAAWPNKRWPAERFGEVAAFIQEVRGLPSFVLWGPGEEGVAGAVVDASGGTARIAPRTSLADLLALSRAASLLISGDTGPLHIAAAAGTPIVAIFGPTDPHRNGPWAPDDIAVSRFGACGCHYERRCRQQQWCLDSVSVAEVTAAVQQRLLR